MTHKCFADGCQAQVRADRMMCFKHWRMVPPDIQRQIWRHWQKDRREHLKWAARAFYAVAVAERRYQRLEDGVFVNLAKHQMEVDIPLLLERLGVPDTPANRERVLVGAKQAFAEKFPEVPTIESR